MSCKARECSHFKGLRRTSHCLRPDCPNFIGKCKDCKEKWGEAE